MGGAGALAVALPATGHAQPLFPDAAEPAGAVLFADEFDGPPGAPPDPARWTVATARETIRNPAFWDRPENMGQYRDDRQNVFLDGNSNLVIRATREALPEGLKYFSGKLTGNWRGGIGHTWEARIKLDCLIPGCWPAWWMLNDLPGQGGEIDVLEWFGNGTWGPGSTVHTKLDGTSAANHPIEVDNEWHTWRCQWDVTGIRFWKDPMPGMPPYFEVPAGSMAQWRFNDPGFQMWPVLNLAVSGSGGGDPAPGVYPAEMRVDYVRVW
ncbi:glycoside hydrolase family 16 protein [Mycolicibacterium sp.]|uniref:glycoside hydrolase family 16 protein n=1 Tax=Mycolicibacterium sp. TaxID=2320850 RepID=UPI003D0CB656